MYETIREAGADLDGLQPVAQGRPLRSPLSSGWFLSAEFNEELRCRGKDEVAMNFELRDRRFHLAGHKLASWSKPFEPSK